MAQGFGQPQPQQEQQMPPVGPPNFPTHMAHGGAVPNFCPNCGYAHSGVAGYAFGGSVGGMAGGFFGHGQQMAPKQQGMGINQQAPQSGGSGYTYNPEGGVTGGYSPADPWGADTHNRDTRVYGQAVRGLGGFGQAGYFDPRGNQMLINSMNEGAQGTADALVRRQMASADLGGLDPAQAAVAKLQAQREAGRGVQDIMANTRAQALGSQNDFAQNLYRDLLGGDLGFTGQTNQARLNDWQQGQQQRRQGGGAGGFLGGLAGRAIGGYTGNWADAAGKKRGGG